MISTSHTGGGTINTMLCVIVFIGIHADISMSGFFVGFHGNIEMSAFIVKHSLEALRVRL